MVNDLTKTHHHLESTLPYKSSKLKALTLGEALNASADDDLVVPAQDFSQQALVPSFEKYLEKYKRSIEDPAGFWSEIASEFYWKQKWGQQVYSENLDIKKGKINIEWFKGGITNICYNCLDKNINSGNGEKVAIHWEGNEPGLDGSLTYNQLLDRVCQLANYLKENGVKKGDSVIIYLPMLMELPIFFLYAIQMSHLLIVVMLASWWKEWHCRHDIDKDDNQRFSLDFQYGFEVVLPAVSLWF